MTGHKTRWVIAANGIIALLFLGLIYAWSIFARPLEMEFHWSRAQTSLTFSISMAAFCMGVLTGGLLVRKWVARNVMWLSAGFVLCGLWFSSQISSLSGLYICYGVLCGFGVGVGYNAVLNTVLAWFPDRQGLMSGVLLMGFGFGGSLLGSVAVWLMGAFGWRTTFRILGVALALLLVISSLLLKRPAANKMSVSAGALDDGKDLGTRQMLTERSFYGYFFWSALLSAAGLALISSAASYAGSLTPDIAEAAMIAGFINICNGIGRLCFGFLLDRLGTKKCFIIITGGLMTSFLLILAAVMASSLVLLAVGFITTGLFYGGITPSNSAYTSKVFGLKHYSTNLSLMNMVLLIAAFLGPYGAGLLQTAAESYLPSTILMAVFCVAAAPFLLLISRHAPGRSRRS